MFLSIIAKKLVHNRAMMKMKVKVVFRAVGFEIIFFSVQSALILLVWEHHSEKIIRRWNKKLKVRHVLLSLYWSVYLPSRYLLVQSHNRNTRSLCEICLKFTIDIVLMSLFVNFEHISHIVFVFPLLTWSK